MDRRRLEGLIGKIIGAGRGELDGTLRRAARRPGTAACNGEIGLEIAEALLVRAAQRAGLAENAARRVVAGSFHMLIMGEPSETERRRPRE